MHGLLMGLRSYNPLITGDHKLWGLDLEPKSLWDSFNEKMSRNFWRDLLIT
jgi:hypothetical protein